ncbi:MAG: YggS family pyridoxal phosphate-dependent enzyme [Methylococcales bacterium]|jgi:pyridoxal phosphate enzyme (YggS family)|nr:YggS family pyridoxal phosphate-dependent enzyme [Methylococcaceae bacterium]
MNPYSDRISQIQQTIATANLGSPNPEQAIQLLAVSKTKPSRDLSLAYQAGLRHFGESYLQEALGKQDQLAHFAITWHFIGPIQSNKTRAIANNFSWVHSVDRLKIAKRLNEQRAPHLPPLNIFLQVNISGEQSKSGVTLDQLPTLVSEIRALKNLSLRGVMAIPEKQADYKAQCRPYRDIYQAIQQLKDPSLNHFSFGMSGDMTAAVHEGATIVRVGTALFGQRN